MNYEKFTLANGLRVVICPRDSETTFVRLKHHFGARDESRGDEGLAHFVEHTTIRGGGHKYKTAQMWEKLTGFGQYDAFTNMHETVYSVHGLPNELPEMLSILADSTLNPSFDETIVEQERQAVLREIQDYKKMPGMVKALNRISALYYFEPDAPSARESSTIGEEDVVRKASSRDLQRVHARGYAPNNADLIIVGALNNKLREQISIFEEHPKKDFSLGSLGKKNKRGIEIYRYPSINQDAKGDNISFDIHIPLPAIPHPDIAPLIVCNRILGAGADSLLYRKVREELGLAYQISSSMNRNVQVASNIDIQGSIHGKRTEEGLTSVFAIIDILKQGLVAPERVERVKKDIRFAELVRNTSLESIANRLNGLLEEGKEYDEVARELLEVTPEDVQRVAQTYLPSNYGDKEFLLFIEDPSLKEIQKIA
ncbi:MAG: pitrilysin family protein [Nanoarchaeota archaeon]